MNRVLVSVLCVAVLVGGFLVMIVWNGAIDRSQLQFRSNRAKPPHAATVDSSKTARNKELDDAEANPDVVRSILSDLELSIEIQPQWTQEEEFLIQVNLEKPLGKVFLVDALDQSCILYVDNRPYVLLRQGIRRRDPRKILRSTLGSTHPVFRLRPDIPEGSELMVEWINYNPRTRQIEKLQSKPLKFTRKRDQ